jgi:phosphoribosyl 1,2-cyclic phosphodiesterase
MRAWTLGSGSRGNALLLESEHTRVLVDNGYPARILARRLARIGVAPESIDALVVTHEHVDHSRGVRAAQKRWRWQVFGSPGTLGSIAGLDTSRATPVLPGVAWTVGCLSLELVRVPHDARSPTAVLATARSGFRTGIAHDLGCACDTLRRAFTQLDLLLLESNHDEEMLRTGPYPPFLQERILGRNGHLSNRQSATLARELSSHMLREMVLLHLSEVNNTPRHAVAAAELAQRTGRRRCPVTPAPQDAVAGPFGDRRGARGATAQLALAL